MIENLGNKLKMLREERDLTMDLFVADFNNKNENMKPLNKSSVSRWENGENTPSLDYAARICEYYDISLDYLIGNTDVRTPSRLLAYSKKIRDIKNES